MLFREEMPFVMMGLSLQQRPNADKLSHGVLQISACRGHFPLRAHDTGDSLNLRAE
jgi:hypothetical protein